MTSPGLNHRVGDLLIFVLFLLNFKQKCAFSERASVSRNSYRNHALFSNCILELGANLKKTDYSYLSVYSVDGMLYCPNLNPLRRFQMLSFPRYRVEESSSRVEKSSSRSVPQYFQFSEILKGEH